LKRRRLLVVLGCTAAVVAGVGFVIGESVLASVDEYYSPGMRSRSAAEASRRGVLLKRVGGAGKELAWGGGRYRVREAWIEDQQQVYRRWVFLRRDSLLNRPRLIVAVDRVAPADPSAAPLCVALGGRRLRYADAHELEGNDCERWFARVSPPFPDSVTLSVSEP
jgi:hypothetical protein